MKRRTVLRTAGVGTAALAAGCGSIPLIGGGCGPGEEKIGDLASDLEETVTETPTPEEEATTTRSLPKIKGSIESTNQNAVVISDGTGSAKLTTLGGGFRMQNVESGDCAYATGFPVEPDEDEDVDIVFYVDDVGLDE